MTEVEKKWKTFVEMLTEYANAYDVGRTGEASSVRVCRVGEGLGCLRCRRTFDLGERVIEWWVNGSYDAHTSAQKYMVCLDRASCEERREAGSKREEERGLKYKEDILRKTGLL